MASARSARLRAKKKKREASRRCDWTGPKQFVKIHSDTVTVVINTAVIGKADFAESLFRKRLEELTEGRAADESTAEHKTDDPSKLEMRFDRNGTILQIILDAMRGYPMDDTFKELPISRCTMLLADCEFYQVPSIGERCLLTRTIAWDLSRIQSATHSIIETLLVRKGENVDWKCNALSAVLRSGDHKWVEFNIEKTTTGSLMFGVAEASAKTTAGFFGNGIKGVGYRVSDGFLAIPGISKTTKAFAGPSAAGDHIRVAVHISTCGLSAFMTVSKNGSEIGSEELQSYISFESGLVFAVCTKTPGDEVEIIGSGEM